MIASIHCQFRLPLLLLVISGTCSAQLLTWNGSVDTSWGNAANWTGGGPPTTANDVVIPSGTVNSPSTSGVGSAQCNNLTLNSGAVLTVACIVPPGGAPALSTEGIAMNVGVPRYGCCTNEAMITTLGSMRTIAFAIMIAQLGVAPAPEPE